MVINSFGGLKFAQDSEGNWGYIPSGADTVVPFKSGISMENAIFTFGSCGAYANNVHRTVLTLTRTLTVPNGYKKLYITCNFERAFTNFNWSVVSYSASGAITSSKIIYQPVSGNMSECIIECDVTSNANITFALYTNTETLSHMLSNLPCGFIFTK